MKRVYLSIMEGTFMSKLKKIVFGSAIVIGLFLISVYYINSYTNKGATEQAYTQSKITVTPVIDASNSDNNEKLLVKDTTSNEGSTANTESSANITFSKEDEIQIDQLINKYYDVSNKFDSEIFSTTIKKDTKELFHKKKEIIESYENMENFIKQGINTNSYFVFTVYDIKFKNIKTLVPGMSVLSVIKDENGRFLINNTSNNKDTDEYIKQLAKDKEIKVVIEGVNQRLTAVLKKDVTLKKFVKYIKDIS